MPFRAINTYEEELEQQEQRHSVEQRLEEAVRLFRRILTAQAQHSPDTRRLYSELFELIPDASFGVVSGADVPPAARRLRAMAAKNWVQWLLDTSHSVSASEVVELIVEALELTEGRDAGVLELTARIVWAANWPRLARLALEELVGTIPQGQGTGPLSVLAKARSENSASLLGPRDRRLLDGLEFIIAYIEGREQSKSVPSWLALNTNITMLEVESPQKLLIPIERTWSAIVRALDAAYEEYELTGKAFVSFSEPHDLVSSDSSLDYLGPAQTAAENSVVMEEATGLPCLELNEIKEGENTVYLESAATRGAELQNSASPSLHPHENANYNEVCEDAGNMEAATYEIAVEETAEAAGVATGQIREQASGKATSAITDEATVEETLAVATRQNTADSAEEAKEEITEMITEGLSEGGDRKRPVRDTGAERGTKRARSEGPEVPIELIGIENTFAEQVSAYTAVAGVHFTPVTSESGAWIARISNWDDRCEREFAAWPPPEMVENVDVVALLEHAVMPPSPVSSTTDSDVEFDVDRGITDFICTVQGQHISVARLKLACVILERDDQPTGRTCTDAVLGADALLWSIRTRLPRVYVERMFELWADASLAQSHDGTAANSAITAEICRDRWRDEITTGGIPEELQPRHAWVAALIDQRTLPAGTAVERFEEIAQLIGSRHIALNLVKIPDVTHAAALTQIARWRAAAVFERVFAEPNPDTILEILIGKTAESEISTFVAGSSTDFRLRLWLLLWNTEVAAQNLTGARRAALGIATAARSLSPVRQLAVLEFVSTELVKLVGFTGELFFNGGPVTGPSTEEAMTEMADLIACLQIVEQVTLFEEATLANLIKSPDHPGWQQSHGRLGDLIAKWWAITYAYLRAALPEATTETTADFLSIIHERLGRAGVCNSASGLVVRLHLSEIIRWKWPGSELDLNQCLHCRYGLVAGPGVATHAPPALDAQDAPEEIAAIAPVLAVIVLAKRSPGVALLRTDLRSVLEQFSAAVGGAPTNAVVESMLEQPVTTSWLVRAWTGRLVIPGKAGSVQDLGDFWYIWAVAQLGQCRARRRTIGDIDIDGAVAPALADLLLQPRRVESWLCLSQMLEMRWELHAQLAGSSDGGPAANAEILRAANACQQALIAAGMALSLLLSTDLKLGNNLCGGDNDVAAAVLAQFGRMLAFMALPPLQGLGFFDNAPQRFVLQRSGDSLALQRPVPNSGLVLKLATRALRKSDPYLAAHTALRLRQPKVALRLALCALPDVDAAVFALQIVVTAELDYSYAAVREIAVALKLTGAAESVLSEARPENKSAVHAAVAVLEALLAKTKWLHRPRYILARYFQEQKNPAKAAAEIGELFSLRSGEPLRIWRTDGEWPGLRGVYMLEYWMCYADLLLELRDEVSLGRLAHRFRRFTAEVPNHLRGWEHTMSCCIDLARSLLGLPAKYAERLLPTIPADFKESLGVLDRDSPWLPAVAWALELRRLNNGYGATAGIDDLVVALFLRMWSEGALPKTQTPPQPEPGLTGPAAASEDRNASPGDATLPSSEHASRAATPALVPTTLPVAESTTKLPSSTSEPRTKPAAVTATASTTAVDDKKKETRKRVSRKEILQAAQHMVRPVITQLNKQDDLGIPAAVRRTVAAAVSSGVAAGLTPLPVTSGSKVIGTPSGATRSSTPSTTH